MIANQKKATPSERAMIRRCLAIPPSILGAATKMAPYARNAAIPLAMGALSSLRDNIVDSIFGAGIVNGNIAYPSDDYRFEDEPRKRKTGGGKKSAGKCRGRKTESERSPAGKRSRRFTTKRRTNSSLKEQLKDMLLDAAKTTGKKAASRPKPR